MYQAKVVGGGVGVGMGPNFENRGGPKNKYEKVKMIVPMKTRPSDY